MDRVSATFQTPFCQSSHTHTSSMTLSLSSYKQAHLRPVYAVYGSSSVSDALYSPQITPLHRRVALYI